MLKFLVLCLLVVSAKACCAPPQVEASAEIITGFPYGGLSLGSNVTYLDIHYDAKAKKVAVQEVFGNKTIWDYQKSRMYQINIVKGTCDVMMLKKKFHRICVPGDLMLNNNFFYGDSNQTKLPVANYLDTGAFIFTSLDVTTSTDTCVPITMAHHDYEAPLITFMKFANVVRGIKDPSVFTPPQTCNNAVIKELDPTIKVHPYLGVPLKLR